MPKTIHSTPRVCHRIKGIDYNMNEQWYVHFRIFDPSTRKRKQKRIALGINYVKNKQERIAEANALCAAVKERLKEGWNPFEQPEIDYKTIYSALVDVTSIRWESLRPRSKHSYNVIIDVFYQWLKKKGYDSLAPDEFTKDLAIQYMDYLSTDKKLIGRTYNNRLISMRTFFNYLLDRDVINKNPFSKLKKQQETRSTRNYAYSDQELAVLFPYLQANHRQLYYFTRFIYGLYVRPNEAARLQIKDINFHNWTVSINPEKSKTKSFRVSMIPDSFIPMFNEMNLQAYPPDYYIFSIGCKPGPNFNPSFDKLTPKLKKIVLKLNMNPMCTMYSFRHSGIIKLYKLLKFNIYECMQITGHTEMASFQNYLKSLGFVQNESFRSLMD